MSLVERTVANWSPEGRALDLPKDIPDPTEYDELCEACQKAEDNVGEGFTEWIPIAEAAREKLAEWHRRNDKTTLRTDAHEAN